MRISDWSSDVCSSDLFWRWGGITHVDRSIPGAGDVAAQHGTASAGIGKMALWRAETALQGADDVLTLAQSSQGALGIGPKRPARAAALLRHAQLRQVLQTPNQQGAVTAAAWVAGALAQVDYHLTAGGGQGQGAAGKDET